MPTGAPALTSEGHNHEIGVCKNHRSLTPISEGPFSTSAFQPKSVGKTLKNVKESLEGFYFPYLRILFCFEYEFKRAHFGIICYWKKTDESEPM
jgi:hypothetical protein